MESLALPPTLAPPVALTYERDIGPDDLRALDSGGVVVSPKLWSSSIKRITMVHHSLARFVAEGRKTVDIAALTGISPGRIKVLEDDPAFKQLVHHYGEINSAIYYDVHQRLATTAQLAVEEINARLEENGKDVSMRELKELAALALDRIGVPAESMTTTRDATGRADLIAEEVRKLFTKRTAGVIIEGEAQPEQITLVEEVLNVQVDN